jgi:hypothetical protein
VADSLSQAAADLYAMPPAEFTAARDELAKQARAAGQRDDAALIKKLTRPTVSAWLVNQLVRTAPEPMGRLYELGLALHAAQQELAGDKLRELSGQRRQVIAELMPEVTRLAASSGVTASASALDEVRGTLEAALADSGARDAVRTGQLTRALSYAGLGEVDPAAALAVIPAARPGAQRSGGAPGPKGGQPGAPKGGAPKSGAASGAPKSGAAKDRAGASGAAEPRAEGGGSAKRGSGQPEDAGPGGAVRESAAERARQDLAEAEAEVAAAAQRLAEADGQVAAVAEQRQFLGRRMEQLREELADAEAEGRELAKTAREAHRVKDAAARAVTRAERLLTQARQRVRKF